MSSNFEKYNDYWGQLICNIDTFDKDFDKNYKKRQYDDIGYRLEINIYGKERHNEDPIYQDYKNQLNTPSVEWYREILSKPTTKDKYFGMSAEEGAFGTLVHECAHYIDDMLFAENEKFGKIPGDIQNAYCEVVAYETQKIVLKKLKLYSDSMDKRVIEMTNDYKGKENAWTDVLTGIREEHSVSKSTINGTSLLELAQEKAQKIAEIILGMINTSGGGGKPGGGSKPGGGGGVPNVTDPNGNHIPQCPAQYVPPRGGGSTPSTGNAQETVSPIILDLDRNGINTTDEWGYYFDHNGNGLRESTGWVGQGDGLLVRDINSNGVIDDGGELFGNNTLLQNGQKATNGFEALAEFDENGDGLINANDAIYHELKVWVDANGDGKTDAGELKTLAELGIASIGTGYTESKHKDENGNLHKQIGEITFTDGTTSQAVDVWFEANLAKRQEDGSIIVTDEIRALVNVAAFGDVHDLHQAMVLDPSLKELLAAVVAETDATKRSALLDQLIYRWAGSEDVAANSRGGYMDARQLVTLERLTSSNYWGTPCEGVSMNLSNPHGNAAPILIAEYNKFKQFVEAQILAQTRYGLGDIVLTQFGSMTDDPEVDWQKLLDRRHGG